MCARGKRQSRARGRNGGPACWSPAAFPSRSSTSPAYPSLFSRVGAKSNSNISDGKLRLARWPSCNEGLDCMRECLKEITTSPPSKPLLKVQLVLQLEVSTWSRWGEAGWEDMVDIQKPHFEKVLENSLVKGTACRDHGAPEFVLHTYLFDENLFSNTLQNSYLIWKKLCVPGVC